MSLLRHGHASLCASSPKPTPVAADLLVLTKAEACVRSYLNKLQDHYYRSSLDDRICDSSFHNVANGYLFESRRSRLKLHIPRKLYV